MNEIKVGDRVKVEYEGEVIWVGSGGHDYDIRADSGDELTAPAQYVTKVAPPEPPIGSVVIMRSHGDNEAQFQLVAYKRWPSGWFTRNEEPQPWELVAQREIIAIHEPE